ncbi:HOMEOBOX LEUCINE ZIPPER PROTEIN [Salix koriyanagi]|uniref:HOMEOBOX LEUCINE ZIPPER PROTEIN n=1 Tax=Salix koriyanagi TaxID=2511006 RepID=A0A9Q0Q6Y7_9ROSI|nr:HOMEOBOX LEUCINE ZIPPER PROTEIN [Salix koriyanagi]
MEKLIRMTQMDEPLGMNSLDGIESMLNEDEYTRIFPHGSGPKLVGFKCEASRESDVSFDFRSAIHRVVGNYYGALQVMAAEFQLPTPLVPTRRSYYVRYCKQHADGTWVVVDVSLDNIHPSPAPRCRRRPPGIVLSATTSFWLPVPPKRVLISCVTRTPVMSGIFYQMVELSKKWHTLLMAGIQEIMVAIFPDGTAAHGVGMDEYGSTGGSLLTVAFQILVESGPTTKLSLGSVATVNNLIACTMERIKASLSCESA